MLANAELKLHFINVNHGEATIIEFPDYGTPKRAHFGVVDFGAEKREDRKLATKYMEALVGLRKGGDAELDYTIDFVCVTHPHDDHFGGVGYFLDRFADPNDKCKNKVERYWDCQFRTNAINYNTVLKKIYLNRNLTFSRVASGSEYEFGETRVSILAPSVDLRNRFDTYGIDKNDASIVLRIKFKNSYVILSGDAQFASWGKITEEFPRLERITFYKDALGLAERKEKVFDMKEETDQVIMKVGKGERLYKFYFFRPLAGQDQHFEYRMLTKEKANGTLEMVSYSFKIVNGVPVKRGIMRVPEVSKDQLEGVVQNMVRRTHTEPDEFEELDLSRFSTIDEQIEFLRKQDRADSMYIV